MTDDPADRLRKLRDDLARKAIWAAQLNARKDRNGFISPEAAREAKVAAGILQPEQIPESHLRLARLEAAERHNLTVAQADAMTGTTAEAIEVEAKALATPPGDTGARTRPGRPQTQPDEPSSPNKSRKRNAEAKTYPASKHSYCSIPTTNRKADQ